MTYTKKQREYVNKFTAEVTEARSKDFEQYTIDLVERLTGVRLTSIDEMSDKMIAGARLAYERKIDGIVRVQCAYDTRTIQALENKGFITFMDTVHESGDYYTLYKVNI